MLPFASVLACFERLNGDVLCDLLFSMYYQVLLCVFIFQLPTVLFLNVLLLYLSWRCFLVLKGPSGWFVCRGFCLKTLHVVDCSKIVFQPKQ